MEFFSHFSFYSIVAVFRVIATGFAWLIRFRILTVNGLVFQTQVAYLIPIFGIIFGYFLMDEIITWKVILSLVVILIGIYIFKKTIKDNKWVQSQLKRVFYQFLL